MAKLKISPIERVLAGLELDETSGCLLWRRALNGDGYGWARLEGRPRLVHRWLWEHMNGPVPDGFELDHLCRNRACANLDHLEVVTPAENARRAAKVRAARSHCKHGHPFDESNTYWRPTGGRACKTCRRAAKERLRRRRGAGIAPAARTHCPRGHAYNATNTYLYRGERHCRTCRRESMRRSRERRRLLLVKPA